MAKYNELYDLVVEDRVSRGGVFNNELLNVFVERRRDRKSAKQVCEPDAKKRRIVPKDDMGLYDTLFENVIATNVIGNGCNVTKSNFTLSKNHNTFQES